MKRSFTLLLTIIFSLALGIASARDYNKGSAENLSGKTYVLTIFVGPDDWTVEEQNEFAMSLTEAEEWLTAQAARYGVTASFQNGYYGTDSPIDVTDIIPALGSGDMDVDILEGIMKKIGYTSNDQFIEWVDENTDCDNLLAIIAANVPGCSYSMAYSGVEDERFYFESTLCFRIYSDGYLNPVSAIAHEMLHLMGADDLYTNQLTPAVIEEKATELYPNDIMLCIKNDIEANTIGPFTAWAVGLPQKFLPEFNFFLENRNP